MTDTSTDISDTIAKYAPVAQVCLLGVNALTQMWDTWDKERTRVKNYLIGDKATFDAMVRAFQNCFPNTELPSHFETKEEDKKHYLTMEINRAKQIAKSASMIHADPILFELYDVVVFNLVESLKIQESSGGILRWLFSESNSHSSFVVFICEFLHWANTDLCGYEMTSRHTLKQLEARLKYLRQCHDIHKLIPTEPDKTNKSTITRAIARIMAAMEITITNLKTLQEYHVFQKAIEDTCQKMCLIATTSLSAQYYMIDCLPTTGAGAEFTPPEITDELSNGYTPLKELDKARETVIFQRIKLFLKEIRAPRGQLIWAEPPNDVGETLATELKTLALNQQSKQKNSPPSGFSSAITTQAHAQLEHQKAYLIALARWVQAAKLLKEFLSLHYFRGAAWSFCGQRGGRLLAALQALIKTLKEMLQKEHKALFDSYLKQETLFLSKETDDPERMQFNKIQRVVDIRTTAIGELETLLNELLAARKTHVANQERFNLMEYSIIQGINSLSTILSPELKIELGMKEIIESSQTPDIQFLKTFDIQDYSLPSKAQAQIQAEQGLLEALIRTVLKLSPEDTFSYELAQVRSGFNKENPERMRVLNRLFSSILCTLITRQIESVVTTEESECTKPLQAPEDFLADRLQKIIDVHHISTHRTRIELLSKTFNILSYVLTEEAKEFIKGYKKKNPTEINEFIRKMESYSDADRTAMTPPPVLEGDYKGRVLEFIEKHYSPSRENRYTELCNGINNRIQERRKSEIADKEQKLKAREDALNARETELNVRETELSNKATALQKPIDALSTQQTQVQDAAQKQLKADQAQLEKDKKEFKDAKKQWEAQKQQQEEQRVERERAEIKALTVEQTIEFMINNAKQEDGFLSFWKDLCCLDHTTGLFKPKSAFARMSEHYQIRQKITLLKKDIDHLREAKCLLKPGEQEANWILEIHKASTKALSAASTTDVTQLVQEHCEILEKKLTAYQRQYKPHELRQTIWSPDTERRLLKYYTDLEASALKRSPGVRLALCKDFFDTIYALLLKEHSTQLDDILKTALGNYDKADDKGDQSQTCYWQQMIYGLTMLGAVHMRWLDETINPKLADPTTELAKRTEKLMMLVKFTPILLDILAHRSLYIAELSFIDQTFFSAFYAWINTMGRDLYESKETQESVLRRVASFQFGGNDLRVERIKAWSQGLLLMHLLINAAPVLEENIGAQDKNAVLFMTSIEQNLNKFAGGLSDALQNHKDKRNSPLISWFLIRQYPASMDELNQICSGLEEFAKKIAAYRNSFASSIEIKNARCAVAQEERGRLKAETEAAEARRSEKISEEKAKQEQQKTKQAEEKAQQLEEKAQQAQKTAEQAQEAAQQDRIEKEQAKQELRGFQNKIKQRQKIKTQKSLRTILEAPLSQAAFIKVLDVELEKLKKNEDMEDIPADEIIIMFNQCLDELCTEEPFTVYRNFIPTPKKAQAANIHTFFAKERPSSATQSSPTTHANLCGSK